MRYAILADIHGNLPALEAVLADLSDQSIDEILVAGDLVSGCPYPHETLSLLRELNQRFLACRCIRGNNESYMLSMHARTCHPDMLTNLQWGATRWAFEQLTPDDLDWIANLPAQLSLATPAAPTGSRASQEPGGIRVVHGSLENENTATVPERDAQVIAQLEKVHLLKAGQAIPALANILAGIDESVLICAHIHVPWLQREGDKLGLNPGAVGMPINGDPRAQYAILLSDGAEWQVVFRQVEYDRARVQRAFQSSGLLAAGNGFAHAGMIDLDRAQNTIWNFVRYASALAKTRGHNGALIPDPLWAEAVATFDWDA